MTADDIEPTVFGQEVIGTGTHSADNGTGSLPPEIMSILEYLSQNNKIVFKSQQRNEPELQQSEKLKVAKDIYQRNPQTFLIRFGKYLENRHLLDFARLSIADSDDEMHLMVRDYQLKLKTRQQDVKNRRYAALQKLIREGEYFSEEEMMKRSPELYQELVGQYLSSDEKKQRDSYDVKNTTFSGILMHNLVQKQISEIMEKAEEHVKNEREDEVSTIAPATSGESVEETEKTCDDAGNEADDVPENFRQQWGNFDNEQIACSSSKLEKKKRSMEKTKPIIKPLEVLITADERELLRQEFVSQMHQQFLSGQDNDFDYTAVDDNTQFDDLTILNQDKEDKYFEESDDDDYDDIEGGSKLAGTNEMEADESEDELDMYMCHLNKHHSLQK